MRAVHLALRLAHQLPSLVYIYGRIYLAPFRTIYECNGPIGPDLGFANPRSCVLLLVPLLGTRGAEIGPPRHQKARRDGGSKPDQCLGKEGAPKAKKQQRMWV